MKRWIPILLVSLACLSTSARADFYVGASYVSTDAEFDTAFESFDTDDSAYKFFAGLTIFKFLGLEASYRDLGQHEQTVGMSLVNLDLEAIDLSARATLPLGKLISVYGKAGYANITAEGSFDLNGAISLVDSDEWELMYGVGVDINFGKHFGVRGEWETFDVDDDLNSFSAGAFFKF